MTTPTYLSPGYFDSEIDQSQPAPQNPTGVPAGVIGTANRGPAFVPVTVGNFDQFTQIFNGLDPNRFGPYAVYYFLTNRSSLTFMRVLGAGANQVSSDITRTQTTGRTLNAGLHLDGVSAPNDTKGRSTGIVQFLVAEHTLQADEAYGPAVFTDNSSFNGSTVRLVRGMVMTTTASRIMVTDGNHDLSVPGQINNLNDFGDMTGTPAYFKLIVSSSEGSYFYNDDGNPGCHIMTASFNPDDSHYYAKLLNTNPDNFVLYQHYLYADFAVDDEIATATVAGVLSGTANFSLNNPDTAYSGAPYNDKTTYLSAFGAFDTRFQTPQTTNFISQPFGNVEYDLFAVQALDDGQYANNVYKISIVNIQASTDPTNPYGTFALQVRAWSDTDVNPSVIEQFNNLSLNPNAANYIAAVIGDRRLTFNFDTTLTDERRIITSGKYNNNSTTVRVIVTNQVDQGLVPPQCLPFGFRGPQLLKTNDTLTDNGVNVGAQVRINGIVTGSNFGQQALSGAILPPVPFRSKVTQGARPAPAAWFGEPGPTEQANQLYYWGTQFERLDIPLDPNTESAPNALLSSYTQFLGIANLDNLVTGSGADTFNNNKFSLKKVAFSNLSIANLTASIDTHMREAAYIRNGSLDHTQYTINDGVLGARITFATLLALGTPQQFNRFAPYLKFTSFMAGGWDGVNLLDPDGRRMNDLATSFDEDGEAAAGYISPGFGIAQNGSGQNNATVQSYITAVDVMTDALQVNHNILAIPGIREPFITDYAMQQVQQYGLAYYIMDLEQFDEYGNRLYDTSTTRPDVDQTASGLATRALNNNYVGTYFPDVYITDPTNNRRVLVPSSIAALSALGFNDRVGYPWFAPAGFNRAALDFVTNVRVRLNSNDRDTLYNVDINPIATFPRQGFVIWGQKTLQQGSSALDRVNVRRLLVEVKRIIINIANKQLEFENNTPALWNKFVTQATIQLGLIQAQAGIEKFTVTMNETNNTPADADANRVNGSIVVIPTRTIEFIGLSFIITQSGVTFV